VYYEVADEIASAIGREKIRADQGRSRPDQHEPDGDLWMRFWRKEADIPDDSPRFESFMPKYLEACSASRNEIPSDR
jgi:hypothetical protein